MTFIQSLKNSKSSGCDGIDTELIKRYHLYILEPLVHTINFTFSCNDVPTDFKKIVNAIFKSDDKEYLKQRPITLISTFSNIFQKRLKNRLYYYLISNNILSPK